MPPAVWSVRSGSREQPDGVRAWAIALTGSVAMIFTFGTVMSYAIFRNPLSDAFDVPPVTLSAVFALLLFSFFIGSGVVGMVGARFPARPILLGCALTTGAVAPSLFFVDTLAGVIVVFGVLGLALGTSYVLVASVVPRWFERYRATATGLIFVGNGVGLFMLPPIWEFAVAEIGIRYGFLAIMCATSVAFLLTGVVCRRPTWAERSTADAGELLAWIGRLGRDRTFQLVFVGVALSFAWYQLFAAFAIDMFAARGFSRAGASVAFGAIGGISIFSRIGGGYVADFVGVRRAYLGSLLSTGLGVGLVFPLSDVTLGVAILLLGLGLGGTATLYIPLVMNIYPPERDTAVVGVFHVGVGVASLAMPTLGTALVTHADGFGPVLGVTLAVAIGGLLATARGTTEA